MDKPRSASEVLLPESYGQNLALTVLDVPCSLDSGVSRIRMSMAIGSCDRANSPEHLTPRRST